jgi:hypothetical protein
MAEENGRRIVADQAGGGDGFTYVVSGLSRTVTVRLKADTTYISSPRSA